MGVWSGWQPSLLPAHHQEAVEQNEEREGDRDGVLGPLWRAPSGSIKAAPPPVALL
jgi:hypothetical protein